MMVSDFKRQLFDFFSSEDRSRHQLCYAKFHVDIIKSDDLFLVGKYHGIQVIEYQLSEIEDELIKYFLDEYDLEGIIEEDGIYVISALFRIGLDSDDYRSWNYINEAEIIEFEFIQTINEYNRLCMIHSEFGMGPPFF
jgi:hypothetical protein